MKKNNHYKKEIELNNADVDAIKKFADTPEGKEFGLYPFENATTKGVTGGRLLHPNEIEGEGLPPEMDNRLYNEYQINFNVRLVSDETGNVELLIAEKNAKTYFKFSLKGLDARQAILSLIDFKQRLSEAITYAIHHNALVCYRRQDENKERRKELKDNLVKILESNLKEFLNLRKYKPEREDEQNGIKITTYVATAGRDKGAKNKKPLITIEQIRNTILQFKYSETFPTQAIVARRLKTSERTIQRHLKNAGVKKYYNDFAHSIMNQE